MLSNELLFIDIARKNQKFRNLKKFSIFLNRIFSKIHKNKKSQGTNISEVQKSAKMSEFFYKLSLGVELNHFCPFLAIMSIIFER